jgi:hypothetical protein
MIDDLMALLMLLLLAGLLWWWFFFAYKDYRIALLRQELFKIRDELFARAAQGEISFDHAAYGMARTTLNGMIRFAHQVSFLRFIVGSIVHRYFGDTDVMRDYTTRWRENIEALPAPAQQLILSTYLRMHAVVLAHIVHTSIIGLLVLVPLWHMLRLIHLARRLQSQCATFIKELESWQLIDAEANAIGISLDNTKEQPVTAQPA